MHRTYLCVIIGRWMQFPLYTTNSEPVLDSLLSQTPRCTPRLCLIFLDPRCTPRLCLIFLDPRCTPSAVPYFPKHPGVPTSAACTHPHGHQKLVRHESDLHALHPHHHTKGSLFCHKGGPKSVTYHGTQYWLLQVRRFWTSRVGLPTKAAHLFHCPVCETSSTPCVL